MLEQGRLCAPDFEVKVLEGQSIFLPLSIKCGADQVMAKPAEKFTEWQLEIGWLTTPASLHDKGDCLNQAGLYAFVVQIQRKTSVRRVETAGYEPRE